MVAIFTLTASLLYADQNLMAPNLTAIAEEFGFNEEEKVRLGLSPLCNSLPCVAAGDVSPGHGCLGGFLA
jgi:hypothetical protein